MIVKMEDGTVVEQLDLFSTPIEEIMTVPDLLKSMEEKQFYHDGSKATFDWFWLGEANEHNVIGGYGVASKNSGFGSPIYPTDSVESIREYISKFLIK